MNCLHLIASLLLLSGSHHVIGFPQDSPSAIESQPSVAETGSDVKTKVDIPAAAVAANSAPEGPTGSSENRADSQDVNVQTTIKTPKSSPASQSNPSSTSSPEPLPLDSNYTTTIPPTTSPVTTTEPTTSTTKPTSPTTKPTSPTTKPTSPTTKPTTPTTNSTPPTTTTSSTTTTTEASTTTSTTTTEKPTTVTVTSTKSPPTTSTAAPEIARRFDGPSFIGGIVFALGVTAIGFIAWKFYKARTERNYHTL